MMYRLYTDGSCIGNPGAGGYGGVIESNGMTTEFKGAERHTTNNRMELMAVIQGLSIIPRGSTVHIISDSQYVLNGINKWIYGWEKRQFVDVKNGDLWVQFSNLRRDFTITTEWVRGHNGHKQNERCDALAHSEAIRVLKGG